MKSTHSFSSILFDHFYVGIAIILFYLLVGPVAINNGLPGISILLIAEVAILLPLVSIHLRRVSFKLNRKWLMKGVILYTNRLPFKKFILWTLIGIVGCIVIYVPHFPLGIFLRESAFGWLPEWYFNPTFGTDNTQLIANVFLAAILVDGFIGPIAEELFFRGYLLPRMQFLKGWAPVLNGAFFGLYHFWQPHNYIALIGIGIVLSYVVWKTKNVYVGIAVHCTLNVIGAIGGYLAIINGVPLGR